MIIRVAAFDLTTYWTRRLYLRELGVPINCICSSSWLVLVKGN